MGGTGGEIAQLVRVGLGRRAAGGRSRSGRFSIATALSHAPTPARQQAWLVVHGYTSARSLSLAQTWMVGTGAVSRPGSPPSAAIICGTRCDTSRDLILYNSL